MLSLKDFFQFVWHNDFECTCFGETVILKIQLRLSRKSLSICRHVFGINNRFNENIHFLNSHVLIYVAGRNIIFYDIEEHSQRFVIGSTPSSENWVSDPEICSVTLSPNTKYFAIAERGEQPNIAILDTDTLRKMQMLAIPSKIGSKAICSMSFCGKSKYLAIQCGAPDWKMCIFEWEKGLMAHCITTSKDTSLIHRIAYCQTSNLVAVCHEDAVQIHKQRVCVSTF